MLLLCNRICLCSCVHQEYEKPYSTGFLPCIFETSNNNQFQNNLASDYILTGKLTDEKFYYSHFEKDLPMYMSSTNNKDSY